MRFSAFRAIASILIRDVITGMDLSSDGLNPAFGLGRQVFVVQRLQIRWAALATKATIASGDNTEVLSYWYKCYRSMQPPS